MSSTTADAAATKANSQNAIRSGKDDGLIVATIQKNASEFYVLEVGVWKKKPSVSARVWYTDKATGELKPGREGFSATPENAVKLRDAFDAIVKECQSRGWLPESDAQGRAA